MPVAPSSFVVLAHVVTSTGLPINQTAVAYLGIAVVVLTALALRTTWLRPRLRPVAPRPLLLSGTVVGQVVAALLALAGTVVSVTLVIVALTGDPAAGGNLAPLAIFFVLWLATVLASVLIGEAASLWTPTLGVARLAHRMRGGGGDDDDGPQLWWLAPFAVWTLLVMELAWYDGTQPRPMGVWLIAYLAVFGVGGVVWGPEWVRRHDPFVVSSRAVGAMSPIGRTIDGRLGIRKPLAALSGDDSEPGTIDGLDRATVLGIAAALIGGSVFQRVRASHWWAQHAINASNNVTTAAHLAGLTWFIVLAAAIWFGVSRFAETQAGPTADRDDARLVAGTRLAGAAIPVAVGLTIARFIVQFALQTQNVVLMASDPFDKGWDLFGTIDWTFHTRPFSPAGEGWTQLVCIVIATVAALLLAHDRLVADHGARGARRAQPLVALTIGAAGVASLLTLLGA